MYEHLTPVSVSSVVAMADAFMEDSGEQWLTKGRTYRLYELRDGRMVFKSDLMDAHQLSWGMLNSSFAMNPWVAYVGSIPTPEWLTYDDLLAVHSSISSRDKPKQRGEIVTIPVVHSPYSSDARALRALSCVFAFEATNKLEWCLVAIKELK